MHIAQLGNMTPPHSTENEVRRALTVGLGHDVRSIQEDDINGWRDLIEYIADFDAVIWTRTADLCKRIPLETQRGMLVKARRVGTPTVGFHLDRWHGLIGNDRESSVWAEPFFHCQFFYNTDGAHDAEWAAAGVNACWMPPAVSEWECVPGTPRDEWRYDVGFLGSVGGYHKEHPHRHELIRWLADTYGDRFHQFPGEGRPAIRRDDLRDLIASVKVWVGDSCLAPRADGGPMVKYWSDRIPEQTGRGAFMLHPFVEGLAEQHQILTWPMGDWDALRDLIDRYLADDHARQTVAAANHSETLRRHTYTVRMAQVLEAVTA